ncbi:putative L-type lectin-domain containing receptor kinase S.7 [Canna indica]|uniref:non-specific serine/threonine protein kinase n=1 Tax=Canna indica TaxID=4628 RepID=A0AAQ3QPZ8_9LILI|nr:putative L-type lectin-domain containing receptor kinase S.7 [Canna indica]
MAAIIRCTLLLLLAYDLVHLPLVSSSSSSSSSSMGVSFDFASFSFVNLTLLGDSYLRNGTIGLTRETNVPSSSAGAAICTLPIRFLDPPANASASFATKFSFSITNPDPDGGAGDGLTFFLSPGNSTLGSAGGYLGLFNSSAAPAAGSGSIIAIEFDDHNHVGLDVDSPIPKPSVDLTPFGIDLESGKLITAWIEYRQNLTSLKVWLGYSGEKPRDPVLATTVDLSKHFAEHMYVGFSASTEGSTEVHTVQDWTFQTSGPSIVADRTSAAPHNFSGSSWSVMPAIPIANSRDSSRKKLSLGLVLIAPAAFGVAFIVFVWVSVRKWMELKAGEEEFNSEFLTGPRKFSYRELSTATRGFHSSRILGNGAFGTVYKAILPGSGTMFAVKRSKQAHQSKTEFIGELSIIARLRHKNLVQLEGWCAAEKNELLLVYEFMPNGSLDKVLHRGQDSGAISTFKWPQRYNSAIGVASVLTYLHQECEQQVIHRDIKSSNIMLDANFNPRLGDFGLARLMDHDKSPVSTLTAGTMGYLAPEYLQYGKATEMTDVFSYGVVILEICCGRRPIDSRENREQKLVNLVDWVWRLYAEDKLLEAADRRLNGEFDEEEMVRLLLVGLSCANPNCAERPTMRRVLQILNCEAEPMAVPKTKPLLMFASAASFNMHEIVSELEGSVAVVTVSTQF